MHPIDTAIAIANREITTRRRAAGHLAGCAKSGNAAALAEAEGRLTDLLVRAAEAGLIADTGDDSPSSRVARWMAAEAV